LNANADLHFLLSALSPADLDRLLAAAIRERQRRRSIEAVRRDVLARISQSGYSIEEVLGSEYRESQLAKSEPPYGGAKTSTPALTRSRRTSAEASRRRREALLARSWPTSAMVGVALGSDEGSAAQRAAELRARGELLGAWSGKERTFVHPECQFDTVTHEVLPVMRQLLAVLPAEGDKCGWRRTFWLYGPRDALNGQAPADLLATEPARVVALARSEFGGSAGDSAAVAGAP
jgi:hypothetical protein